MTNESAEVLSIFFAISKGQIERDIAEAEENIEQLMEKEGNYRSGMAMQKSSQTVAYELHKRMVKAKAISGLGHIAGELRHYFAAMAANQIAEMVADVAYDKGRLSEIGRQIDDVQSHEGLRPTEYWANGEGPEDYQQLIQEDVALFGKIYDTIITSMLRRYKLHTFAELYDSDRVHYDQITEMGRKMIFDKPQAADAGGA